MIDTDAAFECAGYIKLCLVLPHTDGLLLLPAPEDGACVRGNCEGALENWQKVQKHCFCTLLYQLNDFVLILVLKQTKY